MANVTLYHPDLKETTSVPEQSVPVLEKSGWTAEVPQKYEKAAEKAKETA